jgi:orotidine-5'-phosphate decarboxylase
LKRIILALDTKNLDDANNWISATKENIAYYKVGLEFFLKFGSQGLSQLRENHGVSFFLDLKLHDIPNTVGEATSSIAHLEPTFLTVHASGGSEMIKAAVANAGKISVTAVTILTSLSDEELKSIGFAKAALESAVNLAKLATDAGASSIVCSPFEVSAIRSVVGPQIKLITPGVRPEGSDVGDQKRVMTPRQAVDSGADYLVIGRPITQYAKESLSAMSEASSKIANSI